MSPLGAVERELLDRAAAGESCDVSGRPAEERQIAASVIADLCRGAVWPVHARGVHLVGASLEGPLELEHATLPVPLRLRDCEISAGVDLTEASVPLVHLTGCRIGAGVRADGLQTRRLGLHHSEVDGPVELRGAVVERMLVLLGTVVLGADADGISLDLRGLRVDGSVLFRGARTGAILAMGASIAGNLEMDGTELTAIDPSGYSLDIRGMTVGGSLFLRSGFVSAGAVRALGASIGGGVELSDATIRGADDSGTSLLGEGLQVGGGIIALSGFESAGAVWLDRASIRNDLWLLSSRVTGCDVHGTGLHATGLRVGGAVRLDDLVVAGAVRLSDGVIDGSLTLQGAQLTGAVDSYGNSLVADGLRVGRSLHLGGGFAAAGEVRLVGATIDGQLSLEDAAPFSLLTLRGARCSELADTRASWPAVGRLELRGFRFDALKLETGWAQRLDWVRRQGYTRWSPEPYEQLAAYYSATGDEDAARRVRVAKHDDELIHLRTTRRWRSLGYRMWRRPLGWLVGYGYRRHRTAWLLVATLLLAGWLFQRAEEGDAMVPNEPVARVRSSTEPCGEAYPCFNSWVYGADVVLPIIDFGQDTAWRPIETPDAGPRWIWARWAFIALGWLLASVFVAAFTGLVQRP